MHNNGENKADKNPQKQKISIIENESIYRKNAILIPKNRIG
jgi:hypothetical protein